MPRQQKPSDFKRRFGYEREEMESIAVLNGQLRVHPARLCKDDETCCIHKPSDHHMKDWPLYWRSDTGVMERIDPDTGIGHPDPDAVTYHLSKHPKDTNYGVHGCDGACQSPA